jgi:hypothetical protein
MRRVAFLLLLGTVTTVLPLAAQGASNSERAAVVEFIAAVGSGMAAGDFASLDTLFSDSRGLHIIEGAGVNHGWADYRDNHLAPELEAFENFSYRWFSIEPVVAGDAAWASFQYELIADTENGHVESDGRGTIVLQRQSDRWRVMHLHTSGRRRN